MSIDPFGRRVACPAGCMGSDRNASDIYWLLHFLNVHGCADTQPSVEWRCNFSFAMIWWRKFTWIPIKCKWFLSSPKRIFTNYTIWWKIICDTSKMGKWLNLKPTGVLVSLEILYNHGILQLLLTHNTIDLNPVPPCRLRPPVLSDLTCLACWVVVIYTDFTVVVIVKQVISSYFSELCFAQFFWLSLKYIFHLITIMLSYCVTKVPRYDL